MITLLVSLAAVAIYLWQDGIHPCNDGDRYTSGKPQPYPFHRRFHLWPAWLLRACTLGSLVSMGVAMGSPGKAILLLSLPGAWFLSTHPTTIDAPAMLLAWASAILFPAHPYVAILLSVISGIIYERAPVYAALYAWHPLLLVGLVGVQWWARPTNPDKDKLVGRGLLYSIFAHRKYNDLLDPNVALFSLRGLPVFAAYFSASPRTWIVLAISFGLRLVGTDFARFMFWAAPAVIRDLPELPAWMVLVHVVTFRRMI